MSTRRPTPNVQREQAILEVMGTCVSFTGIQHDTCTAGVAYASFAGAGLPCLSATDSPHSCPHRVFPTRDKADATVRLDDAVIDRLLTCRAAIVAHHQTHPEDRVLPCPTACGGELRYSIARNGHIRAACSTVGCVRWME